MVEIHALQSNLMRGKVGFMGSKSIGRRLPTIRYVRK